MKREVAPKTMVSPITGDTLTLDDGSSHNDEVISVYNDYPDDSPEYFDDIVMYINKATNEVIYLSVGDWPNPSEI